MEIIVFVKKAYYKMLEEIKRTIADGFREGKADIQVREEKEEWITAASAKKILKCGWDKLKSLRDQGEITISQSGRNVLYNTASLYEHLNRNIRT